MHHFMGNLPKWVLTPQKETSSCDFTVRKSQSPWINYVLIFSFQTMNLVDFLAILPYVISICLESLEDLRILGKAGKIMRLVRVMRILRIFKLVRHFAGLQSLLYTLKQVSWINSRCLMVSTHQADSRCFYFKISWILMERHWFYFFCPLHLVQGLRSNDIK